MCGAKCSVSKWRSLNNPMRVLQSPAPVPDPPPAQTVKEEPPIPKPDPTPPPVQKEEKSDAAKVTEDDDLEKELELDLENVKIDDTIDPSVSIQHNVKSIFFLILTKHCGDFISLNVSFSLNLFAKQIRYVQL